MRQPDALYTFRAWVDIQFTSNVCSITTLDVAHKLAICIPLTTKETFHANSALFRSTSTVAVYNIILVSDIVLFTKRFVLTGILQLLQGKACVNYILASHYFIIQD